MWSCGAGRAGGADLGGLLAVARHPERELALALQVGGLGVEPAHHRHVAVEPAVVVLAETLEIRQVLLGGFGGSEHPFRGEKLHRGQSASGTEALFIGLPPY